MITIESCEKKLEKQFKIVDDIAYKNQKKVLNAFIDCRISTNSFAGTSGYGYDDVGRDNLAKLYSEVFKAENAIVSPLITCGSHAISTVLYGLLRPHDILLSVTGSLYDTLQDTLFGKDNGSLEEFLIRYKQIELKNGEIDLENLESNLKELSPKVVFFQRSRGYSSRKALSVEKMSEAFQLIKKISPNSFIVVDNCYGEFVEEKEPTEVGADVCVGSLIKNIGGGIAQTGGYIVGKNSAIQKIATRFTSPSLLLEVGSYEQGYRNFYQGLFIAPHVVAGAIKGAMLVGQVMSEKGYKIIPSNEERAYDIIKSVVFNTEEELIKFVQTVQAISPVDSFVTPLPWDMPGYEDQVIMSAGTFVGGASIELSCDSPIKKPYIAYFQGGLTYEHIKIFAEKLLSLY
jgi:cystathionine beta-lyase family protein involved in aluminum resistance